MSCDNAALSDSQTPGSAAPYQLKLDRILTKVISSYSHFQPVISERLRSVLRAKLWRMGKQIHPLNSKRRNAVFDKWKKITWNLVLKATEVRSALINNQVKLQQDLTKERELRTELESKVARLEEENATLQEQQSSLSTSEQVQSRKRKARKSWDEYTPRHKRRKLEEIKNTAIASLDDENLEVVSLEMRTKASGSKIVVNTTDHEEVVAESDKENTVKSILLVKDKYSISNAAYHELAMSEHSLPRSCQINKQVKEINQRWEVTNTPDGTIGVQISLKKKLTERLEHLVRVSAHDVEFLAKGVVRVKVTGDGTWVGKRLHIVTFGFTLLEEGAAAKSSGNHSVCLLKQPEDYHNLALGLEDIRDEINQISSNGISVSGKKFDVHFYLGGDWKFIAAVCGLDAANSTFSCIWCKCAKNQRHSLENQWSIVDEEHGARTTRSIIDASKLPKKSTNRYNVSHEPLFTSIPMHRVIPDNLHMFLRIGDVLINLLILEL